MYRTVVIPVAWNDPAEVVASVVDHGATLARQVGADVELVSVFPEHVDADKVSRHLHDVAATREPALVALSTHGRSGLDRLVMGSIALAVTHQATCPVVVHRPSAPHREESR
jgi:nucleotide-binding universal stress UspA family protein